MPSSTLIAAATAASFTAAAYYALRRTDGIAFSEAMSEQAVIATVRCHAAATKSCRSTVLTPSLGSGCAQMKGIPEGSRNRPVAEALIKHLHAFVKETEPTMEEWEQAMDFLVRVSQWSHQ